MEPAGKATTIPHKSVDVGPEQSFTPKQILQDWWEGCLTPGFLIGRLLSIKMNDSMCKNIIARVKVNYCAYKIFTAHLKVNYCACEIDSGFFFSPLYLPVIILGTLEIPHFVETCGSPTKDSVLKQIPICALQRNIPNMGQNLYGCTGIPGNDVY